MAVYKNGSKGDMVKTIQIKLNEMIKEGHYLNNGNLLAEDGKYGKKTEAVIKEFQKAYSLKADGICGPCTLTALGLTKDVNLKTIPLRQFDGRWADECYGKKGWAMPRASFRKSGCGCTSAVICWLYWAKLYSGVDYDQYKTMHWFADAAIKKGYRIEGNGTSAGIFSLYGLTKKSCTEEQAEAALRDGKPVAVCVKAGWSSYTGNGHWVVLHGIEGDCFLVNDVGSSAASRQKVNMKDWKYVKSAYIVDCDINKICADLPY